MTQPDVPLRTVFPVFQKLVAMDTSIAAEYIFVANDTKEDCNSASVVKWNRQTVVLKVIV